MNVGTNSMYLQEREANNTLDCQDAMCLLSEVQHLVKTHFRTICTHIYIHSTTFVYLQGREAKSRLDYQDAVYSLHDTQHLLHRSVEHFHQFKSYKALSSIQITRSQHECRYFDEFAGARGQEYIGLPRRDEFTTRYSTLATSLRRALVSIQITQSNLVNMNVGTNSMNLQGREAKSILDYQDAMSSLSDTQHLLHRSQEALFESTLDSESLRSALKEKEMVQHTATHYTATHCNIPHI